MDVITGKDNKRVKQVRLLMEKSSQRKKTKTFIAEGIKMVNEALDLGLVLETFLSEPLYNTVFSKTSEKNSELLKLHTHLKEFPQFFIVSDSIFKSISDTVNPQGILAITKMPEYNPADILSTEKFSLLVLEDLADPGNVGTIFRTAEAAGISAILLTKNTVDLFNPKTVRSTMGSIFRLPFIVIEDLEQEIKSLKSSGVRFYAAHLKGKQSYREISYADKSAIFIGNEARGLSELSSNLADEYIKIPMSGKVESLNAAVAAALIMYEVIER